jgi:hypothetical protein
MAIRKRKAIDLDTKYQIRSVLLYPRSQEREGVILFYHCPSKIFFVVFFSATINGRNLIFCPKLHIGMPYCG